MDAKFFATSVVSTEPAATVRPARSEPVYCPCGEPIAPGQPTVTIYGLDGEPRLEHAACHYRGDNYPDLPEWYG